VESACSTYGRDESIHKILVLNPVESCRRRWMDNINMDLKERGSEYYDWIQLTQDRDQGRA
jgi:hypothetical protein